MVPLRWILWPPEPKTEKKMISPRPVARFQNNIAEMFLVCSSMERHKFNMMLKIIMRCSNIIVCNSNIFMFSGYIIICSSNINMFST